MLRNKFLVVLVFCVLQALVPARGAVLCVGEDGHVAIELMGGCPLETPDDNCESGRDAGSCPCCISEADPRDCNDTPVSPFSLSSRSSLQKPPEAHSGWAVSVTGVHASALSFVAANSSGHRNPFLIESATQRSISSVILRI